MSPKCIFTIVSFVFIIVVVVVVAAVVVVVVITFTVRHLLNIPVCTC